MGAVKGGGFTDISRCTRQTVANAAFLIFLEYAVNKAARRGIRCSTRRNEEIEVARALALDPPTNPAEKGLAKILSPFFPPHPKLKCHRERY